MSSVKFRSVSADHGCILVHVTAFLPLGLTKEIRVRLTPDDARQLIQRAELALGDLTMRSALLPPRA